MGRLNIPGVIENTPGTGIEMRELIGSKVPDHRRVWLAIRTLDKKGFERPYMVTIPKLGTLRVGRDEYGADCWEVDK